VKYGDKPIAFGATHFDSYQELNTGCIWWGCQIISRRFCANPTGGHGGSEAAIKRLRRFYPVDLAVLVYSIVI